MIPRNAGSATWVLRLSTIEKTDGFPITSVHHLAAFIKFLGKKLPALVERCGDLREVDRMVNAEREIEGDTPIVRLADHLRRSVPVERA